MGCNISRTDMFEFVYGCSPCLIGEYNFDDEYIELSITHDDDIITEIVTNGWTIYIFHRSEDAVSF